MRNLRQRPENNKNSHSRAKVASFYSYFFKIKNFGGKGACFKIELPSCQDILAFYFLINHQERNSQNILLVKVLPMTHILHYIGGRADNAQCCPLPLFICFRYWISNENVDWNPWLCFACLRCAGPVSCVVISSMASQLCCDIQKCCDVICWWCWSWVFISLVRPQSVVWFALVLPKQMRWVGRWKQKTLDFLKKIYAYCQLITYNKFCAK